MQNQKREYILQKKFSKDSVTSTKFFDSTEELPEASFNSVSSNSSKLSKEYKTNEPSGVFNTEAFICEKKRVLSDSVYNKIEHDLTENLENERKVDITTSDYSSINSEKLNTKEHNLNTITSPENKDINTVTITDTSVNSTSYKDTNIPADTTHCYKTDIDNNINNNNNNNSNNNLVSYFNSSDRPINTYTYNSTYSNPTVLNSTTESVPYSVPFSIPTSISASVPVEASQPISVPTYNSSNYSCSPISYSSNFYMPNSYCSPKRNITSHSLNNENNFHYINDNTNLNCFSEASAISYVSDSFTNPETKTFDFPTVTSTIVPHISENTSVAPTGATIKAFDNCFKEVKTFQSSPFKTYSNNNNMEKKTMDFLNMYNNNNSNSNNNYNNNNYNNNNYNNNNNDINFNNGNVNNINYRKQAPVDTLFHSSENYFSDISNLATATNSYSNVSTSRNVVCDSNGGNSSYINGIGRSVNGTVTSRFSPTNTNNINKPFVPENGTEKRDVLPTQVIDTDLLNVPTKIAVSDKISSEPDYARATHSSHVIDKKFVHEGFDTIKIPKYREVEIVEKIVEVPVIHKVNKYVDKYEIKQIEKSVTKPIKKYIETMIEVPEFHYQDKVVEVPEVHEIVKVVEKPEIKERIIYKNNIETKIIPKYIEVPVVKIVDKYEEYDDIQEVIKTVPIKKIVEIPTEVIKKVKVPIKKIIEQPNYVPIIKYRDVPIEKIRYVPKVETVELTKTIPKIIDVHVPVKVPKVQVIDKPYYVNKYVDKYVNVPVSKRITPIYKCSGKKIVEIPIHKPYIVTHDTIVPKNISSGIHNGQRYIHTHPLDINSFSSAKKQELYNMVNDNTNNNNTNTNNNNNFISQRSISADTMMNFQEVPYTHRSHNMNQQPNTLFTNSNNLSNGFSNPINMRSCSFQSTGKDYMGVNNKSNYINKVNNLKFTRSLNTQPDGNIPSFNHFSNRNNSNNNKILVNSRNTSMNEFSANDLKMPYNSFNNDFKRNSSNTFSNNRFSNNRFSSPNTFTHYNYNKRYTGSFPDLTENKFHTNSNSNNINNNNNLPHMSRNISNNSNYMNGTNYDNRFLRSRSPSVCSEGISAYVVEHVGQSPNFGDSNVTVGSRCNMNDFVGSGRNYSFNESFSNGLTKSGTNANHMVTQS